MARVAVVEAVGTVVVVVVIPAGAVVVVVARVVVVVGLVVVVVGGRVVASMKRNSPVEEFRSNVHRGAETEVVQISEKERKMALNASKYLGLGVAGVDLIRSGKGPLLLEVNASPGLYGIETTTGVNVAREIIRYVEAQSLKKR